MNDGSKVYRVNDEKTKDYYDAEQRFFVDHDFFNVFSFQFITGDPRTALTTKYTVVLTETLAKTIFGKENAMGKTIYDEAHQLLNITGIIKDPSNFHVPFKMLRSFISLEDLYLSAGFENLDIWGFPVHPTYLLVNSRNTDVHQLQTKLTTILDAHRPDKFKKQNPKFGLRMKPLADIYFKSGNVRKAGYAVQGDPKKLIAYTSIALFMLFLACINFINLNSAKSLNRAREVGIKKVVGATRAIIFTQFLGEVAIVCLVSVVLALANTYAFLPSFNSFMNTNLSMNQLFHPMIFGFMMLGFILISLISGGFPALYLSSFKPVQVLKGLPISSSKKSNFKKVNLAFQFAITIILLIGSLTVFRQIEFMKNADLGLNTSHRLVFNFSVEKFGDKVEVLKRNLLENPKVNSYGNSH